ISGKLDESGPPQKSAVNSLEVSHDRVQVTAEISISRDSARVCFDGAVLVRLQVQSLASPSGAPNLHFSLGAMYVLCPGPLLQVFTVGTSDRLGWVMWVLAVLVNGPVY